MRALTVLIVILVIVVGGGVTLLSVRSSHTTIAFDPQPRSIGTGTLIKVRFSNPHSVRSTKVVFEQSGKETVVDQINRPASRFQFSRGKDDVETYGVVLGKKMPDLKEGNGRITVSVQANDFLAATDSVSADVEVILKPPTVTTDEFQHYINQGGSEMALLTPSGSWQEAGVRVGTTSFRSFPVSENSQQRLSLFAYSWDTPTDTAPVVFAKNSAGAEATARFWFKVFPKKFKARDLTVDDGFLTKVDNEIDPAGSGDLVTRFLKINGEIRRANNKTLADLRLKTAPKFLWTQAFLQMANSKVESSFADVRTYVYKGKKIDQQVHLGFDLATTQHAPVMAANDGKVVWAAPLGIYGNCIVLDHGYGLQSIYGHLSELAVKEGDMVTRGQVMGKTGSTGLAGGDHLHFTMQVDGVQINPIEWWDEHWIADHIRNRMK